MPRSLESKRVCTKNCTVAMLVKVLARVVRWARYACDEDQLSREGVAEIKHLVASNYKRESYHSKWCSWGEYRLAKLNKIIVAINLQKYTNNIDNSLLFYPGTFWWLVELIQSWADRVTFPSRHFFVCTHVAFFNFFHELRTRRFYHFLRVHDWGTLLLKIYRPDLAAN